MKRLSCVLFLCALMMLSTTCAGAADIVALQINGLHQHDGRGAYDRLLVGAKAKGVRFTSEVVTPSRAFLEFENGRSLCVSPANNNEDYYRFDFPVVATQPMSIARVYIFSPPGKKPFSSIVQLEGLRVGARTGMPYGQKVDDALLDLHLSSSLESNIRKLAAGRLDAIIAYDPDVFMAFDKLGETPFPYFPNLPVSIHPDQVLCRDTPEGRRIVETLDRAFDNMHREGEFARILEGLDP